MNDTSTQKHTQPKYVVHIDEELANLRHAVEELYFGAEFLAYEPEDSPAHKERIEKLQAQFINAMASIRTLDAMKAAK